MITDPLELSRGLALACEEAGALLLSMARSRPRAESKGGHELVTEADLASQALLEDRLCRLLPDVSFLGEEGCGALPDPPVWLVDPLDGTNNYAHGYPVWSVSAALLGPDGIEVACVHDPGRGETFSAAAGKGATMNGASISCSSVGLVENALLATGFPYSRTPQDLGFDMKPLVYFLGRARGIRRSGSAALDLAYVACGRLDGFWEEHLRPWDMAAGVLLVREAGGTAESWDGTPWIQASEGIVAAGRDFMPLLRTGLGRGAADVERPSR
ncbi:inositol monophosphatase [Candidatus Fermentibacteria bacterium]|nr:inositol monophosphatase [Candidatus Fermentibacteria bacterium]